MRQEWFQAHTTIYKENTMKTIDASEMVIDVTVDNAVMFEPVGPDVQVPNYIRRGKDVYTLLSLDPDGRACYKLR
jgi:hypothetical protein